jgi:choline-sulfatase
MRTEQPNILFIMADQLAAPVLPIYNPTSVVKTPNLNALAEGGVVFDSAYCNSPLCAPSRFVLMTGRLPSKIGAYDNAAELPADIPTFAHYLRDSGYRTALSGKMHFCGPDQLHGFEERLTSDIYPADFGWAVNWDEFEKRPTYYHNMSSITQAGTCVRSNQLDFDDEVVFNAKRYMYDHVRGSDKRPFCLTVSMTHPHDPYACTQEYWDRYEGVEIDLPSVQVDAEDQDPHSRRLQFVYEADKTPVTDEQIRNARRAYYGNISYVDDKIGELLKALKDTGLDENTIIVFSGDHGDMLGERGLWYKMSWFESSARVPMIVHAPERFSPRRVAASVSTMDLLPTFLDLATGGEHDGTVTPIEGRSLVPHLNGGEGHDEVIGEYMGEGAISPLLMIRRGNFKFVHAPGDPDQLFDLSRDPQEVTNLVGSPEHAELVEALRQEIAEGWDLDQVTEDVLWSQRRRRLVARSLMKGKVTPWDFQPMVDASQQYMRNTIDLDDLEARSRFPRVAD